MFILVFESFYLPTDKAAVESTEEESKTGNLDSSVDDEHTLQIDEEIVEDAQHGVVSTSAEEVPNSVQEEINVEVKPDPDPSTRPFLQFTTSHETIHSEVQGRPVFIF